MFEQLIKLITDHPRYGPAVSGAVKIKSPLVLDYHTHGPDTDYCVSIASKEFDPLQFFEPKQSKLEELAHIRGFGKAEEDCTRLCSALADELKEHYELEELPEIYLNGKPMPGTGWKSGDPFG